MKYLIQIIDTDMNDRAPTDPHRLENARQRFEWLFHEFDNRCMGTILDEKPTTEVPAGEYRLAFAPDEHYKGCAIKDFVELLEQYRFELKAKPQ